MSFYLFYPCEINNKRLSKSKEKRIPGKEFGGDLNVQVKKDITFALCNLKQNNPFYV